MFMYKLIFAFLALPVNFKLIQNINKDINTENINSIITTIGTAGILAPTLLKHNEICKTDDDCPLIMRCCKIINKNYCCSPNNFVHVVPEPVLVLTKK